MDTIKSEIISWPIKGSFRIARSTVTEVDVVVATVTSGQHAGRGECRPYPRYNETPEIVCAQIAGLKHELSTLTRQTLADRLPNGAARNAIDCARWDLEAQITGKPVYELMGLAAPRTRSTAFTLSIDTPENMAEAASKVMGHTLLKIKTGNKNGLQCALAVLEARPDVTLIIDANESMTANELYTFQDMLRAKSVALIEQPLPAGLALPEGTANRLPVICADESLHTAENLSRLWNEGYRAVNIKLDKAGGLTEAHHLAITAKSMGFQIMLGCMVSSSLSMAPAMLLESYADVIDLDGALLLAKDHNGGMVYKNGNITEASPNLWGYPRQVAS